MNGYSYAENSPTTRTDPFGLFWGLGNGWSAVVIGAVAIGVGAALVVASGGAAAGLAPLLLPAIIGAGAGGVVGELVGGDQAALNGAVAGGIGGLIPGVGALAGAGFVGGTLAGTAGGAVSSGLGFYLNTGQNPLDSPAGQISVATGALAGGVGAIFAAPFGELGQAVGSGLIGGIGAGASDVINSACEGAINSFQIPSLGGGE